MIRNILIFMIFLFVFPVQAAVPQRDVPTNPHVAFTATAIAIGTKRICHNHPAKCTTDANGVQHLKIAN